MDNVNLEHRLTEVEQRTKSNTHRLEEHDKKLDDITDLVLSVKELAMETKHLREDLNETIQRLSKLESKDADKWEKFKWLIVAGVVTIVLGYLAVSVGLN